MKISIIIPVYNEEKLISSCLDSLIAQNYPKENYEIIVVNDGSTDDTFYAIQDKEKEAGIKGIDFKIVNLEKNSGRATAREVGAKNASYSNLLFIDSRCIAAQNILEKLNEINYESVVGNPIIDSKRSITDRFGWLMRKKLYPGSFGDNFKPIYITPDNFDKIAKGTTVFFCNKELFLSSQPANADSYISDDTKLLRNIVLKKKILKRPDVKVTYQLRTSLWGVIKHTFFRGPKFVDYYLNPNKKYFWLFIFAPLLFLGSVFLSLTIKLAFGLFWLGLPAIILAALAVWLSENLKDFFISVLFLPIFGVSFEAGIIAGLILKLKNFVLSDKKRIIIFIFLVALISGFFWNQKVFGQPVASDQAFYDRIAQNMLSGRGFTDLGRDPGVEPAYPLFLAVIYGLLGHNYDTVRIIQIFIFAFLNIFIFLIVERLSNRKIAIYAALAIAIFYGLAIEAGNITTEMLFSFFIAGFGYAFSEAAAEETRSSAENWGGYKSLLWLGTAGLILGAATLTRGIVQLLPIFIIVSIFSTYFKKIPLKNIFLKIGIFIAAFIAVLSLWFAVHRPVTAAGAVAPRAGAGLMAQVERMEKFYPDFAGHFIGQTFGYYFSEKLGFSGSYEDYRDTSGTAETINLLMKSGESDVEIDQRLIGGAIRTILKEPHKYIAVSVLNFVSFNSPIYPRDNHWRNTLEIHPMFAQGRHPEIPDWQKAGIILGIRGIWFLFFFFVIYAVIKNIKNWQKYGWILLTIVYFNLAYGALHAIPRYALPIYPFYIILAVIGITTLFKKDENLLSDV